MSTPCPAMTEAMAQIAALGVASRSRTAAINADPRIITLRSMKAASRPDYAEGMAGARKLFARMADGSVARSARIGRLLRAREAALDGFPHVARRLIQEAALIRQQHWSVTGADTNCVSLATVAALVVEVA